MSIDQFDENSYEQALIALFKEMGYQYECGYDVLEKFNYIIEPIALTMYRNIEENKRLAELRDTLLPRLMSGELHVNDM